LHCRWTGNNGPEQTDYIAMRNLIDATPKSVKRFILTTSAGVDRSNKIPFSILNLFGEAQSPRATLSTFNHYAPADLCDAATGNVLGYQIVLCSTLCESDSVLRLHMEASREILLHAGVLKFKKQAEMLLQQSGLPWTILRPSRLTDGPYTSFDLNTLLQATAGTRQDVQISKEDDQLGEASRIAVAGKFSMLISRHGRALDCKQPHTCCPIRLLHGNYQKACHIAM